MDFNYSASKTVTIILIIVVLVISIIMIINYLSLKNKNTNSNSNNPNTNNINENMSHLNNNTSSNKRLVIYHMEGCNPCKDIMVNKQSNGMTKCEELRSKLSNHGISVIDYQHGRDSEANKFDSFPNIMIEIDGKEIPHNGSRDVNSIMTSVLSL
jgi:hypothetical protein